METTGKHARLVDNDVPLLYPERDKLAKKPSLILEGWLAFNYVFPNMVVSDMQIGGSKSPGLDDAHLGLV